MATGTGKEQLATRGDIINSGGLSKKGGLSSWLTEKSKSLPTMSPVAEAPPDHVLELDELWSFVGSKKTNDGSG